MYEQECDNVLRYINSWVRKSGGVMKNEIEDDLIKGSQPKTVHEDFNKKDYILSILLVNEHIVERRPDCYYRTPKGMAFEATDSYVFKAERECKQKRRNDAELAKMEFDVENMGQTRLIAIWGLGIAVATLIFDQLNVELAQLMQDLIDWL